MSQTSFLLVGIIETMLMMTNLHGRQHTNMNSAREHFLRVQGDRIVNQKGDTVCLRGFGLGGMLHMENFIDGYPANEESMREGLRNVLGDAKYDLYFETFLRNYFTEPDAAYIRSLGLNLVRIPVNYRLFEDDMNPRVIKHQAFKHLDRVIELCAKHQIYTVIDLHAFPGSQNQHWHSDNPTHVASFWIHKDFQDRALHLWEAIAERYKDQPWVAGYDLMNEPADPTGTKVFPYFKRLRDAVRKIDPKHILFLEGDRYATDFSTFTEVWDNVVYTNHDYAVPGFIFGGDYPGLTNGKYYDKDTLERDFLKKSEFMFSHHVPLWVGEFGPVYSGNPGKDEMRYQILKDQLAYYNKYNVSWCIWLYKDMGLQAVIHQNPNTPYMKMVSAFLAKKDSVGADAWGSTDNNIRQVIEPLEELFRKEIPGYDPYPHGQQRQIGLLVRHILIAEALVPEYCNLFRGKSDEELKALAESFRFDNYVKRQRLEEILTGREK
ncbi:MAG TPA: glycoside hydrolase family 5 protein [Bacteroidota bacterium]|nr:glycoside hydrolase family 5 protein [Bacteroidota bacterium]